MGREAARRKTLPRAARGGRISLGVETRPKTVALPGNRRPVSRGGNVRTVAVCATRRLYVGEPLKYKSREANRADAAFGRVSNSPAPGRSWLNRGVG